MPNENVARVIMPDPGEDPRVEAQAASLDAAWARERDPEIVRAAEDVATEVRVLAIAMIGGGDVEDLEKLLAGVRAMPATSRALALARRQAGASGA